VPAKSTTTIKLPPTLKGRVAAIARQTGRSSHHLMIEAITRHVDYEERLRTFVKEAVAADRAIERGGEVFRADEVLEWMERLARRDRVVRPWSWRR
jgi:predicted transcriptional regulator